jgi:hypothetical protein
MRDDTKKMAEFQMEERVGCVYRIEYEYFIGIESLFLENDRKPKVCVFFKVSMNKNYP